MDKRSTHRPVSPLFARTTVAPARTKLRLNENGHFAAGAFVGAFVTLLVVWFAAVATEQLDPGQLREGDQVCVGGPEHGYLCGPLVESPYDDIEP